jgi:hypothetical protein
MLLEGADETLGAAVAFGTADEGRTGLGAQEAQASALCEKWKLSLLNTPGAVWTIASALHASGKRDVVIGDRRPVHEALTYLENPGERMHYAEARAQGLPIGMGSRPA